MLDTIMIYAMILFLLGIVAWLIGLRFSEFDDKIKKLEKKIDELEVGLKDIYEKDYEKDNIYRS